MFNQITIIPPKAIVNHQKTILSSVTLVFFRLFPEIISIHFEVPIILNSLNYKTIYNCMQNYV